MLRIKAWHKNFETERTATFNRRQQIDVSTDTTDMNLIWLLTDHKNGAAHFAVWILLCELHAFTTKPREGWLSHNGKEDGIPLAAKDLALQIHISENIIIEALERLSSPKIGWIEESPVERSPYAAQEQSINSKQAASPTLALTPPNPTPSNLTLPETGNSLYLAVAKRFHEHQRVNFPKDSVLLKDPGKLDTDGALELERFERIDGWDYDKIVDVLKRVLDDPEYRKNIISLRTVRKRMSNGSMKLENADKYTKTANRYGSMMEIEPELKEIFSGNK